MPKLFIVYCVAIVISMAFANYTGYVFTTFLTPSGKADKAANHYHK